MPSTNKTEYLGLSQYAKNEKQTMGDYNIDMVKIAEEAKRVSTQLEEIEVKIPTVDSGTWIPTSPQVTLANIVARWVKTGKTVTLSLSAMLTKGSADGIITFSGLPFAVVSVWSGQCGHFAPSTQNGVSPLVVASGANIKLIRSDGISFTNSDILRTTAGQVHFSVTYETEV